ncbi:MAG: ATP-binding cassette domain-containing protein, partial [Chthonomonadaceae bacterium]|nr:ATP-binding cassette domain-containing protein [Chthonomonadaceae bacterium]
MADLLFDSVSKGFPGVQALENVSFGVEAGSVHALCGENGAGKSTLLKILSGVYRPDTGSLRIQGQNRVFNDAAEAIHSGVAVIYQELHLVSSLSIAENLFLGHLPLKGGLVDWKKLRTDSAEILTKLGVDVNPDTLVGELPIAIRQMVEIGKALSRDANIFAFDEPTSSLSSKEVDSLFSVINQLKSEGKVILYVSHRMDEIQRVC